MSFLDGLKRKKKKPVREDAWDTPTLFGGLGPNAPQAEKKISVLSAAGGKTTRRPRERRAPEVARSGFAKFSVAAVLAAIVAVAVWQSGVFDRNGAASLMSRIDAWLNAAPSEAGRQSTPMGTPVLRVESVMISTQPPEPNRPDAPQPRDAAVIERVALAPDAAAGPTTTPTSALEAALGANETPTAPATSKAATASSTRATPKTATPARATATSRNPTANATRDARPDTQASNAPRLAREESVSLDSRAEKKVQVARSKDPDPDAQLLEALLIHLRKTESLKSGNR